MGKTAHRSRGRTSRHWLYAGLSASFMLAACSDNDTQDATQGVDATAAAPSTGGAATAEACVALIGQHIPADLIGLPTTGADILSAELIAATAEGNSNG